MKQKKMKKQRDKKKPNNITKHATYGVKGCASCWYVNGEAVCKGGPFCNKNI